MFIGALGREHDHSLLHQLMNGDADPRLVLARDNRDGDLVCGDLRADLVADEERNVGYGTSELTAKEEMCERPICEYSDSGLLDVSTDRLHPANDLDLEA